MNESTKEWIEEFEKGFEHFVEETVNKADEPICPFDNISEANCANKENCMNCRCAKIAYLFGIIEKE